MNLSELHRVVRHSVTSSDPAGGLDTAGLSEPERAAVEAWRAQLPERARAAGLLRVEPTAEWWYSRLLPLPNK